MSAEAHPADAPGLRRPANPITSSQVEVVISTSVSVIGLIFAAQALPSLIGQMNVMVTAGGLTLVVTVFGSLILAGLASVFRQWTRTVFALVAGIYLITLAVWPVIVPPIAQGDAPWIFYLANVASACAVAATRWPVALGFVTVTPVVLALVRMTPSGGAVGVPDAIFDGIYSFLIGTVLLVIILALRRAAREVDRAQGFALDSYTTAVRHNATESERVRVDALVHDNVLVTLLSAARARTPDTMALVVKMAKGAITHLDDAQKTFPLTGADVPIDELVGRLRLAAADQSAPVEVRARIGASLDVPAAVAEALVEAATQALVNSSNHASGGGRRPDVSRTLAVTTRRDGLDIRVEDDGVGFDMAAIPAERLGVRRSIVERVARVGGVATIDSRPEAGTRIALTWPDPSGGSDASAELGSLAGRRPEDFEI